MSTAISYLPDEPKSERKKRTIEKALESLYAKHGKIDVDILLTEAKSPKHPLHNSFEWDNKIAGEKYRRDQAYQMIMASQFVVQLVQNDKTVFTGKVRKLVNPVRGEGFKLRTEALKDVEDRKALVAQKVAVLRAWCNSVVDLDELAALRRTILRNIG